MIIVRPSIVVDPVKAAGLTMTSTRTLGTTSRTLVWGWSVDGAYPDTVLVSDKIQIVGNGKVNINAQIEFDGNFNTTHNRWIVHNGVDLGTATGQRSNVTVNNVDVVAGDLIWFDAQASSTTLSYDDIDNTSWVTITPVV